MAQLEPNIEDIDRIVAVQGKRRESLIPILQAIQDRFHYLPDAALMRVGEITESTPSAIQGVASFYAQFRRKPVGRHVVSVCDGTACHVKGSTEVFESLTRELELKNGEDTDGAGEFTLRKVSCLGCCTLAPAVQIGEVTYGHVRPDSIGNLLHNYLAHEGMEKAPATVRAAMRNTIAEVRVGLGSCCVAGGSEQVREALEKCLGEIRAPVRVKHVSCVGMCHQTPLLEIVMPGRAAQRYAKVQADDVPDIVARHFHAQTVSARLKFAASTWIESLYAPKVENAATQHALDFDSGNVVAFTGRQKRIATEYCGELDPLDLDEYRAHGGFVALSKCISAPDSSSLIETIAQSGLRGRGGAGFPTARKWQAVRNAMGRRKYLICNGDEGDPGAFMDRMILESYPYRVIEGMAIASLAVGANEGVFYIRAEYPLAVRRINDAIKRCEAAGFLGDSVCGSEHGLRLRVMQAAGAFVCGEETALIASIEGNRGMPEFRPPFPAECGLFDCPTLVNNVETYALVPWIFRNGAEAFARLGTEKSKGTKVFSLTGKIQRGGLIEVPMGISIREIVEEIGGGVPDGRTFKAVQIGGPSGGCIPAALSHTAVDFEALADVGAMMGSGGMVVLDDKDCMVEIARYFIEFMQRESCGKCTPCRVGTTRMLEILTQLSLGQATAADLAQLEQLALTVKTQSLCGLGKTAPNPVLTTLRYFREEFEAHLAGHCPAGACRALTTYYVTESCIGCTKCAQECPVDAIVAKPYRMHDIDAHLCTRCDACRVVCPANAILVK